ncbi:ABC transporter substrate-binding protein [Ensifer soli]|uniref:ABC transporter substrate-binding protein n=1 Tax=Ciceribacter sp. sgz301302 TaxID=3342379 RepID=UPI0035B6E633
MKNVSVRQTLARLAAGALTAAVALSAGIASAEPLQITLWHQEQVQARVDQFQKVIDAFNASQGDFKVVQQVQGWGSIFQKLPPAIQAGVQPDIDFSIPDFTVTIRETGAVQPVDDIVAEIEKKHKFIDQALTPYKDEGKIWAVPVYGMVQMLWYRKDLFKAAGLDPESPPKTWEEFLSAAKTLTKDGKYGVGVPASKSLATDQVLYSLMSVNGGTELFDADGKVTFDTPKNVETIGFYKQLAELSPSGIASWTWPEPQDALNAGTVAMAIEKGQYLTPFEATSGQAADQLGCAPIPVAPGGEPHSIYYSNAAMVLTADPEKRKGAAAFLSFVLEPANYAEFLLAEPGLFLPLTEDGATEAWSGSPILAKYKTCVDMMLEVSKTGVLPGFNTGTIHKAIGPIMAQNLLSQVVQKVVVGGEEPQAAVTWGQQQMNAAAGQ